MLSQRLANIVFAGLVIAASAWFAWMAQGFVAQGLLASSGLPSSFFPQLTLGGMALCAAFVLADNLRKSSEGRAALVFEGPGEARRALLVLAAAIACYAMWRSFGFVPMAVLLGPLALLAMGVRNPRVYLAVWLLTAGAWLVFTRLLGAQLT